MRIAVILNLTAGSSKDRGLKEAILSLFLSAGCDTHLVQVTRGCEVGVAARRALKDGYDVLVAGGGDGTVSAVAAVVAGSGAALGVLPLGTLNHFARDLGIPLDLRGAARVVMGCNTVQVDMGEVNGRRFVNNSSLGLYPSIVRYREEREKTGWSRLVAFAAACFVALRRLRFLKVHLQADGKDYYRRSPFLFIGNNRYELEGFRVGRRRRIDEGVLALYTAERAGRVALLRIALSALLHRLRLNHGFTLIAAQEVIVETRRRSLRVALDGEVHRMRPPLRYIIHPAILKVIVPLTV